VASRTILTFARRHETSVPHLREPPNDFGRSVAEEPGFSSGVRLFGQEHLEFVAGGASFSVRSRQIPPVTSRCREAWEVERSGRAVAVVHRTGLGYWLTPTSASGLIPSTSLHDTVEEARSALARRLGTEPGELALAAR